MRILVNGDGGLMSSGVVHLPPFNLRVTKTFLLRKSETCSF